MNTAEQLQQLPAIAPDATPTDIYLQAQSLVAGPVSLACSFSVEDVVLIELLKDRLDEVRVFAIDTGRLNEETYETAEQIVDRYCVQIDWYFPRSDAVELLERDKGLFSFRESVENRKQCCFIRKVEPLQRALKGQAAWLTGLRRAQSATRADQNALEIDTANGGLMKINPLTFWSDRQVWDYAENHRLPVNRLYRQGYASIGCAPCTRAIKPGEHPRAGRWWWEDPNHKECGLHRR